jgi:hypothetical protein
VPAALRRHQRRKIPKRRLDAAKAAEAEAERTPTSGLD